MGKAKYSEGTTQGAKAKVLKDVTGYITNPDDAMVSQVLAGKLDTTRYMDQTPSALFQDDGYKVDVIKYIGAKCCMSSPPKTPAALYGSLDEFLTFCVDHKVPPTIGLFSVWNGVTQQRYNQIVRDTKDEERGQAFANAKELIRGFLEMAALEGSVSALIYFHMNKTMHGFVENSEVTLTVQDNTRELSEDEQRERVLQLTQDGDGVFR
jgi:hypothetical protein